MPPKQPQPHPFILDCLKQLAATRDIKKLTQLKQSVETAQKFCADHPQVGVEVGQAVLEPLALACDTRQPQLMMIALDCLAKLISYNYFANSDATTVPAADIPINRVVDIIHDTFTGETTDDKVQLQIFKALHAAVTCRSPGSTIHQATLLKVIRTAYNIFLLTKKSANQAVAQSILSQMVHHVFARCVVPVQFRGDFKTFMSVPGSDSISAVETSGKSLTKPADEIKDSGKDSLKPGMHDSDEAIHEVSLDTPPESVKDAMSVTSGTESTSDTFVSPPTSPVTQPVAVVSEEPQTQTSPVDDEMAAFFMDAYMVFRAFCRLSVKALPETGSADAKTFALKSKVLSLHLLNAIVQNHFQVISSTFPIVVGGDKDGDKDTDVADGMKDALENSKQVTNFVNGVKSYLCVSLSRNASSLMPDVLDRSLEIFFRLVLGMRHWLKKEIEVFFSQIFLGILESRTSNLAITYHQKLALLRSINKLCSDPQTLVEVYLNYDCDGDALDNTFERIVNILSKILSNPDTKLLQGAPPLPAGLELNFEMSTMLQMTAPATSMAQSPSSPSTQAGSIGMSTASFSSDGSQNTHHMFAALSADKSHSLKFRSLECLGTILQSMVSWSRVYGEGLAQDMVATTLQAPVKGTGNATSPGAEDDAPPAPITKTVVATLSSSGIAVGDDLNRFEASKFQKQATKEGVKLFNYKYKKGISYLFENRVIKKEPASIAKFLLNTPGLDKRNIGEYLGEGEEFNISVMHAFVDQMEFSNIPFVTALRGFLQSFRLPGEAQKIDRYMLKFAERYMTNNPTTFSNADCPYVLAYSVIMLNTDLYNPQVKKRMKREEFIKNNRGINDSKNLPDEFLISIYDEILSNEIKMKDEHEPAPKKPVASNAEFDNLSARQKREALLLVNEEIATRSEAAFKGISNKSKDKRNGVAAHPFFVARHAEHIRSMFAISWMPVLAGISAALQEADNTDIQTTQLCLQGFRASIHLAAIFDLDLERNALISTLTKYAYLSHPTDLLYKPKYVDSVRMLLECAHSDGNWLRGSWLDVLRCVSSLERWVSAAGKTGGIGSSSMDSVNGIIPGVAVGMGGDVVPSVVNVPSANDFEKGKKSDKGGKKNDSHTLSKEDEYAIASTAQSILVAMDRIFAASARLSGAAIVEFVKWLCLVSLEEIQQSTSMSTLLTVPRMYSLTKLVEISYYNMARIRIEWSNIWAILGEHFNQVGCHQNQHVAFFSVDSLRQLSVKFLEKTELSNFKFQKEFLKPFEFILANNSSLVIKDMVLRCVHQIVQARGQNLRSGWKAVMAVLTRAAKETNESLVVMAFDMIKLMSVKDTVIAHNTFPEYISCLVEFARNVAFPKVNLQAVDLIHACVPKVVEVLKELKASETTTESKANAISASEDNLAVSQTVTKNTGGMKESDPGLLYWFPIHFGLYEIIMSCDLEVRNRALKYLFEILKNYAEHYTPEFWDVIARGVIFPIFDDLRLTRTEKRKFENKEDMTVWLNTTLIQALRQLIDMFSFSFETLESMMMDGVLELITVCFGVQHENETLAKIGSSCLQTLIVNNCAKMNEGHWDKICNTIVGLFESTSASLLADSDFKTDVLARAEGNAENRFHSRNVSSASSVTDGEQYRGVVGGKLNTVHDSSASIAISNTSSGAGDMKVSPLSITDENSQSVGHSLSRPGGAGRSKQLKKEFQQIIIKCVLHLLIIQTLADILAVQQPGSIMHSIRSRHLMVLMECLEKSYKFAKNFNLDMELRVALYKIGFMKQLPNLLKQETTSVHAYIEHMFAINTDFHGESPVIANAFDLQNDRQGYADQVETLLFTYCLDVIALFNQLEVAIKQRNIIAWTPVVITIISNLASLSEDQFRRHMTRFYIPVIDIIKSHELNNDLRIALYKVLARVDASWGISGSESSKTES